MGFGDKCLTVLFVEIVRRMTHNIDDTQRLSGLLGAIARSVPEPAPAGRPLSPELG
jgi:hypothetical protein